VDPPRGLGVRPTYDRVRESLFAIIEPRLDGASVLDLFAGTGILGIESLSRGARSATFVEVDRRVVSTLARTIGRLGIAGECTVRRGDVLRYLSRRPARNRFDVVFADPPYEAGLAERALELLGAWQGLAPFALVVVEHESRLDLPEASGVLVRTRTEGYGTTALDFYEARGAGAPARGKEEA